MEKRYQLKILTTDEVVYQGDVVSTTAPGELGYLGFWANHAPLVTTLTDGKLYFRSPDGTEKNLLIGKGFLEFLKNQLTILTESVRPL